MNLRRRTNGNTAPDVAVDPSTASGDRRVLDEQSFQRMISLERKRAERSHKSFLLVLLDAGKQLPSYENGRGLREILSALSIATRETDATGWYKKDTIVGVMFTEIATEDRNSIVSTMLTRISGTLGSQLTFEQFHQVSISFHLFPEDWNQEVPKGPVPPTFYPEVLKRDNARKFFRLVKRAMDIVGSVVALLLAAPVFATVALAIKLTSKGPVFFSQHRLGQYGVPFELLKFRSMYVNNNPNNHKDYVRQLIAGKAEKKASNGNGEGVYKLTDDPRITALGTFLRRTSMDELPQFVNVLKGEMSLVGPRPPVSYEVEAYDLWHRGRLLEAKPGITGLWQVNGRNRIGFDEMVRLDLKYAKTWTPWLDIKILLRTPRAVAEGAD